MLTSGNYLQCNRKILPHRKPKLIPTEAKYPLGNLGKKLSVTATIVYSLKKCGNRYVVTLYAFLTPCY